MSRPSLRLALVGYGKMGRALEESALERGHQICARIDPMLERGGAAPRWEDLAGKCDIALEFTAPDCAAENILGLLRGGVSVVSGSTGWISALDEARDLARDAGVSFVWAPNFALGVGVMFRLVLSAAGWMDAVEGFSPYLSEAHHAGKKDGPSGTARKLAEIVLSRSSGKERYERSPAEGAIAEDVLPVSWIRAGRIPGEHRVGWDAEGETLEIVHRARNRSVFATGALRCAEWLFEHPGVYEFDEVLDSILGSREVHP